MKTSPTDIQQTLGYQFRNPSLLQQALTHRSYAQESSESIQHYERLEFLGDAVLGFLVSESLVESFPSYSEGKLTKLKAYLVSAANLVKVARGLDLGRFLQVGRGEERTGGRTKKALLVDALEAVIAAVYLDGGLAEARGLIERTILTPEGFQAADNNLELDNFKSALQELIQARKLPTPSYRVLSESGPAHRRTFTVELVVGGLFAARAQGSTKKSAEQEAARVALDHFVTAEDRVPDCPDENGETQRADSP